MFHKARTPRISKFYAFIKLGGGGSFQSARIKRSIIIMHSASDCFCVLPILYGIFSELLAHLELISSSDCCPDVPFFHREGSIKCNVS